jgi:predicted acylesterase/phospholipase RssA
MQDARFVLPQVIPRSRRFSKSSLPFSANSFWKALLEQFDLSVLFELEPFQSLVRQTVSLDELRNSILGLKIIATNFDTGKAAIFTADDVAGPVGHAGILASAAIPGFFGQVEINGEFYVDGGVVMNTPLLPAVHGADVLYAVYMDPDVTKIPIENLRSTLGVFDRLLVTNFAFGLNQEIQMIEDFNRSLVLVDELDGRTEMGFQPLARTASVLKSQLGRIDGFRSTTIHRFHPADDLGGPLGFLDFSFEHIDQLIQRGYRDAVEHDCTASGCVLPQ